MYNFPHFWKKLCKAACRTISCKYCCIILLWKSYYVCWKITIYVKIRQQRQILYMKTHTQFCMHLDSRPHIWKLLSKHNSGPKILIKDYYLISQHAFSSRTTGPNHMPAATFVKLATASFLWINNDITFTFP